MDKIRAAWAASTFQPVPEVYLAQYEDGLYATITDNSTVFTFMSQTAHVYTCVRSKCIVQHLPDGSDIYIIMDSAANTLMKKSPLSPITCKSLTDDRQRFVFQTIIPLVLDTTTITGS